MVSEMVTFLSKFCARYLQSTRRSRIKEEELKDAIEKEIGIGKVTKLKEKKVQKALQTRNILMSFVDTDALKVRR
jgi:hypothetical protein